MSFSIALEPHHVVVTLNDRLDPDQIAQLRKLFWDTFSLKGIPHMLVQIEPKATLDAVTLSLLVGAMNTATKNKARLSLICQAEPNLHMLRELDLHQYFAVYPRLEEALAVASPPCPS